MKKKEELNILRRMSQDKTHFVLAYYHFVPLADPHGEVRLHKEFLSGRDITCRLYLSETGINGQMSGSIADAKAYMEWMHQKPEFHSVEFKIHPHHENVFPRQTVKYKKQLVAIDREVDLSQQGEHVSPKQWKEMLENMPGKVLIDVRNDYEWKIGHFEGAELPLCKNFREFNEYADALRETKDPKETPVMMYCTGGIRCELYSAILKEKGFDKVYQLDGGVIGYGLKQGSAHWLGKLFVFDDRLAVPISETEEPSVIAKCHHCENPTDSYYNCANIDCNQLFLSCPDCIKKFTGSCCQECMEAPKRRPYHENEMHKPFLRWHNYRTNALKEQKNA